MDIDTTQVESVIYTTTSKYKSAVVTSIIGGIVVLIAVAWNDVIQAVINKYYPKKNNTITGKLYYATIITLFIVVLQIYLFPYIQDKPK